MKKENRSRILFRYGVVIFFILLFAADIAYHLIDNTVLSADEWNKKAMKELSRIDTILPERGNILAADGSVLATNLRYYTVRIDFRSEKFNTQRYRAALDSLADSLTCYFPGKTRNQWREHLEAPLKKPADKRPRAYVLVNNASYADVIRIREFPFFNRGNRNRTGLVEESRLRRVNPYGDMARRSIGGVGQTAECKEVHGISGLEKALDSLLYGKIGYAKKVPLTKGIVNWTDVPARAGYNIKTTIDVKMQDIVENELNAMLEYTDAEWGVAVLMEVATGDIKAISNLEKSTRPGGGYIEGMNRAVLGYEPGSVVKTISMMIALEDGIVSNLDEVIPIGASYAYAGGKAITDSHFNASLTVKGVIEQSSNIGMTKIITRKYGSNPGGFYSRLKQMGFLEPMHTGIAGETVPRVDSLADNRGGRISLSRQCYGYTTEIPPLFTLSIYNAIANGGRYVRPRLVSAISGEDIDTILPVTYIRDRVCSEANAAKLRKMLTAVVEGSHGTARRLKNDEVSIAGKTGTAYSLENGAYNRAKKRLAFCGFFPADNPKYSCIVLTFHPRRNAMGAPSTSGEVLKNIALKMRSRGMLDNNSDFKAEKKQPGSPTLHASADPNKSKRVAQRLNLGGIATMHTPSRTTSGVPDVRGCGIREAISAIESRGYEVEYTGSGYVVSQSPEAGSSAPKGTKVKLTLAN